MAEKGLIVVVGLGPGGSEDMTISAQRALASAEVVVGYKYYFRFAEAFISLGAERIATGMRGEQARVEQAIDRAMQGRRVAMISSGDASIYGMASLVYEMVLAIGSPIDVECVPGISAFQKAAAVLGAPVGHDFCVVSLSDLLTPWAVIERRIIAAAQGDFITAVYNPRSEARYWQLPRLREIFLQHRDSATPVGWVRQAGREGQSSVLTTLGEFVPSAVDMFTVVIIGNSQSYIKGDYFITPRGYFPPQNEVADASDGVGQTIMMESFRTILGELRFPDVPLARLWPLLHTVHTTADFEMESLLWLDDGAVPSLFEMARSGGFDTIVTDVTMVASGIRRGALQRLGMQAVCYLHDERVAGLAVEGNITRTQAGIRLAVEEHPNALFAIGNAPTALMELCRLIRSGKAKPVGVVAAPVGFVHVEESKQMLKPFEEVRKLIVEGRKGGSPLAATLVNAILTFDDAGALRPGRDV